MTLLQILQLSADLLDDSSLAQAISSNNPTSEQQEKIRLLISCANQVSSIIATDYVHLYNTKTITTDDGVINFSDLDSGGVMGVVSIKSGGITCGYQILDGRIVTTSGTVSVKYLCNPQVLSNLTDAVTSFPTISARIFAYGVVAEYLFIKGNIDDAQSWNKRFEQALIGLKRSGTHNIKLRGWY